MIIGIVTFWEAYDNYGQVLQCWALQKKLESMGHKPYVIRYKLNGVVKEDVKQKVVGYLRKIYRSLKSIIKGDYYNLKLVKKNNSKRDFEGFRNRFYNLSPEIYNSISELRKNPPSADSYICGSDQIWGYKIKEEESDVFYLDFGNDQLLRIAYAPSFGMVSYPNELKQKLAGRLSRFDAISVREYGGVKICEEVGFHAEHVLDPSLLLNGTDYKKIMDIKKNVIEDYVFVYSINVNNPNDLSWESIKKYSKERGLKVIATASSGYLPARELLDGAIYEYPRVNEWLSLIAYSKLVVTTSFHGIAFCLIYHKPFVYVPLKGEHSSGNCRVSELLDSLNLTAQILHNENSFSEIAENIILWDDVEKRLNAMRTASSRFIESSLQLNKQV